MQKIIKSLCIAVWFFTLACPASQSESADAEGKATVLSDSLAVYSRTSKNGKVIKTLQKGTEVAVEMELQGSGGKWCAIAEQGQSEILGYVLCEHLDRKTTVKEWKLIGTKTVKDDRQRSPKEKTVQPPEKKKRPYSDITAIIYTAVW